MKRIIPILFSAILCFTAIDAISQDVIYMRSGSVIQAKILEVGSSIMRYKEHAYLNGPTYTIKLYEVDHVQYENGTVKDFSDIHKEKPRKLGLGANGLGPSLWYSVEIDYMVYPKFGVEGGLGNAGAWVGMNFFFRDMYTQNYSAYLGLNACYWRIDPRNNLWTQGLYFPVGLRLMSQKSGVGASFEVAWMEILDPSVRSRVWAGLKLGVHL